MHLSKACVKALNEKFVFFLSARSSNMNARQLLITVSPLSLDFIWGEKRETVHLFRSIFNMTSGLPEVKAAIKVKSNV